ncbi:MAG: xylulokinase, partial [Anaerolineae bacterium]
MKYLLGIDIGTSSAKALVIDEDGKTQAMAQREYPIATPQPGWAEQEPEWWWEATVETVREALVRGDVAPQDVAGLGFSGQMHGTVLLDDQYQPLCPAIIWADGRSASQAEEITRRIGPQRLARIAGSPVAAGFMAATLLWLRERQPELLDRARAILLPKDYVRLRLTGELAGDVSDASATLLFDVSSRDWSEELLKAAGDIPRQLLPSVQESQTVVGQVTRAAAEETGLAPGTPVVAGGSDQAIGAIGSGVITPGLVSVTIGTGGQLFTPLAEARADPGLRIHTFCHALPGTWHLLGAILSAGLSLRWLRDNIFREMASDAYASMVAEAEAVPPGSEGLLFLPYLLGERTPHMDPLARGLFLGLALHHGRGHLVRAVLEGVTFALRDCLEIFHELGVVPGRVLACGGGARSPLWRRLMANVFQVEVIRVENEEQAALGAALLAGIGVGLYAGAEEACARAVRYGEATLPGEEGVKR